MVDALVKSSQPELTKLKSLLRSKTSLPSKPINLNEQPVLFDPVGPDFVAQLAELAKSHEAKKVEESLKLQEVPSKTTLITSPEKVQNPEMQKPKSAPKVETETTPAAVAAVPVESKPASAKPKTKPLPSNNSSSTGALKTPPQEAQPVGTKWTHIKWHDYVQSNASSIPWVDYMSRDLILGIYLVRYYADCHKFGY